MYTITTNGITISAETFFQEDLTDLRRGEYVFAYRITIQNNCAFAVQLMRRQWFIFDSSNIVREVEGEGVVGKQPLLAPGEVYQYVSGCHLKSDIGKMYGTYLMERRMDNEQFRVQIPEFQLVAPYRRN